MQVVVEYMIAWFPFKMDLYIYTSMGNFILQINS